MPLPLILGGIGIAAALYGMKKGVDAYSDNKEAGGLRDDASDLLQNTERRLKSERARCTGQLEELGRLKFEVWHEDLGRFCRLFGILRNVELVGAPGMDEIRWSDEELAEMSRLSGLASEVVVGGLTAAGTGALIGMASYGGATMFATASTGTAISALSGVAATNATLAWFGGGAITAGGLGMGVGAAVLGGIGAAPVLAIGGVLLAAKARENLANAKLDYALAEKQAGEMDNATSVVRGIRQVANQYMEAIASTVERFAPVLDRLARTVGSHGTDFATYPDDAKREVYLAVQFAQSLKALLETPILNTDGSLAEGHQDALEQGRPLLTVDE